jgi:outer membrane lipoprotein SlyB
VPSGKVKGRASLAIRFTSIVVDGQSYTIAASYSQAAQATKGDDAKKIGIGAAGGAVVGAILGGGKGAAIGTAVGGGAGTAVVLSTSGDEVQWPAGSVIDVALAEPVDVKVPIKKVAAGS